MKHLIFLILLGLVSSFTHPFAQEGSVNNDQERLEERTLKARENRRQEQRARELIREEEETNRKLRRELKPEELGGSKGSPKDL